MPSLLSSSSDHPIRISVRCSRYRARASIGFLGRRLWNGGAFPMLIILRSLVVSENFYDLQLRSSNDPCRSSNPQHAHRYVYVTLRLHPLGEDYGSFRFSILPEKSTRPSLPAVIGRADRHRKSSLDSHAER